VKKKIPPTPVYKAKFTVVLIKIQVFGYLWLSKEFYAHPLKARAQFLKCQPAL